MANAEQVQLSPRIAQAVDVYDGLAERSYKGVAEAMNITAGRAADYVRKGFVTLGREDELPRGGNGHSTEQTPTSPTDMLTAEVQKLTDRISSEEAKLAEAKAEAEGFDPQEYSDQQEQVLAEALRQAKADLANWKADADQVRTDAVEAHRTGLTERATKVEAEVTVTLERLGEQLTGYEAALKMISG